MICERFGAVGQGGVGSERRAALPAPRAAVADCRLGILPQRCRQSALVAGLRLEARYRRTAAAMVERCGKRIMLRLRRRESGPCRGQAALRRIPLLGGRRAALLGFGSAGFGSRERCGGSFGFRLRLVAGTLLLAAVT